MPRKKKTKFTLGKIFRNYLPDIFIISGVAIYSIFEFRHYYKVYGGDGRYVYEIEKIIPIILIVIGIDIGIRRFVAHKK